MSLASNKPKVLVADDERVIADTLVMILNQSGFDARAAYSGEKAVELASAFEPEMLIFDVILFTTGVGLFCWNLREASSTHDFALGSSHAVLAWFIAFQLGKISACIKRWSTSRC